MNEEKIISSLKEIESSKESVRLTRLRYDVGISTLKDVLVRQSELSNAKSKNISAVYNYNLNLDELERLTFLEISKNCLKNNNKVKNKIRQRSSVISYYIIKSSLLFFLNDFLNFCENNNLSNNFNLKLEFNTNYHTFLRYLI